VKSKNFTTTLTALLVLVLLLPGINIRAQSTLTESLVAGNTSFSMQYCNTDDNYSHFIRFHFYGNLGTAAPAYQGFVDGTEITSSANYYNQVDSATIPAGTLCSSSITVRTTNIPITTAAPQHFAGNNLQISNCLNYPTGVACNEFMYDFYFINPAKPDIRVTASVGQISTVGTTNVPVALYDGSDGFNTQFSYAFQTVNASCTTQYGALVSVSPSSAITDATGKVPNPFVITTTRLQVPLAGGQPSATCTFTPANNSNSHVVIQAFGQSVQPTLNISPTQINKTGRKLVTATINYQYAGLQIDASCANNGSNVSVSPASAVTNSSGSASFSVLASTLVGYGTVPTASCTFHVNGGTGSASLAFTTGDACTFGLEPQPPQCGNP